MELAITHPRLAALYRYWRAKAERRRPPLRRAIDPLDLSFCLGHLALAEIAQPFRVRYRLFGTHLSTLYGADLTGRYVDELFTPALRARTLDLYRALTDTGEPQYEAPSFGVFRYRLAYHRLLLPLTSEGRRIDLALVGVYPSDPEIENAYQWRSIPEIAPWLAAEADINSTS